MQKKYELRGAEGGDEEVPLVHLSRNISHLVEEINFMKTEFKNLKTEVKLSKKRSEQEVG